MASHNGLKTLELSNVLYEALSQDSALPLLRGMLGTQIRSAVEAQSCSADNCGMHFREAVEVVD